ncbi:glycosyltransferase family 2 protein [Metaplanococcus flavidus]|uniref:Glycosyltransferase family 2 protein n=1 Tax=Metaplanococcus flavidus TaxID=569883 RepID=A0ABW3LCS1_9BACL
MDAKISVILPIYNVEEYLPKCINSVRNQTYENLEIILVNDGSTDRCGLICELHAALDTRIKVIHKDNGGLSDARNAGMEAATGDFVAFVDSDDWIDEDMYEVLYRLSSQYDADIAMCRVREFSDLGILDESTDDIVVCGGEEALMLMVTRDNNYKLEHGIVNKLIKKELLQNFKFPVGKLTEDLYFTPPLIYASKKCVYIDTGKYNYLTDRQGSIMNSKVSEKMIANELEGYQELERFLSSKGIQSCIAKVREVFLKRLLHFHYEVKISSLENKKDLLIDLEKTFYTNFIKPDKNLMNPKRQLQIRIFDLSPGVYHRVKMNVKKIKDFKDKIMPNKALTLNPVTQLSKKEDRGDSY